MNGVHTLGERAEIARKFHPFSSDMISFAVQTILPANRAFFLGFVESDEILSGLANIQKSLEPIRSPRLLSARFMEDTINAA